MRVVRDLAKSGPLGLVFVTRCSSTERYCPAVGALPAGPAGPDAAWSTERPSRAHRLAGPRRGLGMEKGHLRTKRDSLIAFSPFELRTDAEEGVQPSDLYTSPSLHDQRQMDQPKGETRGPSDFDLNATHRSTHLRLSTPISLARSFTSTEKLLMCSVIAAK